MFCSSCGTQLPEYAAFCSSCGDKTVTGGQRPVQDTCVDGHIDTNINAPVAHVEARVDGEVISQATPDGTSDSSMTGYAALSAPQDRSADQRVKNSEAFAPKMKYITAGICLLVVAAVFVAVIVFQ